MKRIFLITFVFCLVFVDFFAQSPVQSYFDFREANRNIGFQELSDLYAMPSDAYYKGYNLTPEFKNVLYLDSLKQKLGLTQAEQDRLMENHFFITERLSAPTFCEAFHRVYANDLPVFVSTDAILHALHSSYSHMLKTIERDLLSTNLEILLEDMYSQIPALAAGYANMGIDNSLADIDLYLSVAYSLISDQHQPVRLAPSESYDMVMDAIDEETFAEIPLFCDEPQFRTIDFSQFKVRGHYVYTINDEMMAYKSLEPYFKAMMWLGRIDFFLSPPANTPWTEPWNRDEVRRMNIDAFLLNQLLQNSKAKALYDLHEQIINYFVGISDNMSPLQYSEYLESWQIASAEQMLDDSVFDEYLEGLVTNDSFKQLILGETLFANPDATEPDVLPVSFRLSGQRFIIDSQILSNVVYDRVMKEGQKVKRMMPKTLDILFAMGNNDAAYLLQDELEQFQYAPNLANMRYLIDTKNDDFWNASLYNTWLQAIRELNPIANNEKHPFFMQTAAWHHQKMNTQLGSWAQLRHDNLLYAKPSYTSMTGCSFPYSYVEPYPEFYGRLGAFSGNVADFLSGLSLDTWESRQIPGFFKSFSATMEKLEVLATKQLSNKPFNEDEEDWLRRMLFISGESGAPPYSGWYGSLYLNEHYMNKADYITVDIHTQPTDEGGALVGKVLHAGLGEVNMGVFMVSQPGAKNNYIAYTGPFFSYYEEITGNFHRMTDQEWEVKVEKREVPARPDWTSVFLLDYEGRAAPKSLALPSVYLVGQVGIDQYEGFKRFNVYPNPAYDYLKIRASVPGNNQIAYSLTDLTGRVCLKGNLPASGSHIDVSSLKNACYLLHIEADGKHSVFRVLKR